MKENEENVPPRGGIRYRLTRLLVWLELLSRKEKAMSIKMKLSKRINSEETKEYYHWSPLFATVSIDDP